MDNDTAKQDLEVILKRDSKGVYQLKQGRYNHDWEFSENRLRERLLALRQECQYEFLTSVAHPQAVEDLAQEHEKPEHRKQDKDFFFDSRLMETYLEAVAALTKKHGIAPVSYPLVEYHHTGGWPHHEAPLWPVMHVVPRENVEKFLEIARGLNADEAYQVLRKREAPHNYHLAQIDFLREQLAPPLLVTHGFTLAGKTLREAVNVLCTFSYKATERSTSGDD